MTTLDYIIVGLVAVSSIWGAIKGFIDEVSDKFGYFLGLIVALMFTVLLSPVFQDKLDFPLWLSSFMSYVILFVVGYLIMKVIGRILENIAETAHLGPVNRILGFVLGLAEAVVLIGLAETMLNSQSFINVSKFINASWLSSNIILPIFNTIRSWIQSLA